MQIPKRASPTTAGASVHDDRRSIQDRLRYEQVGSDTINEYVTQRQDGGIQGTSTTIYQTTLKLVSDTMAKQ